MIKTVFVIAGPTAAGKSKFSLDLAKKLNGIIINSDSMQVYKNLSILTARPTIEEMNNVEHFLYGYVDGGKRYNVEKWCKDASKVIEESFEKNITPILVGGTGLYINTLINGMINIPSIPEEIKIESEKILTKFGKDFLINQIKNIDPDSLNEININDNVRLRRIWEVFETTGKKFSEWKLNENKSFIKNYNFKLILFLPDRKKNYEIVNSRFIKMINGGAIEEVKSLLGENLNESLPVMRAHGVPEIKKYLENDTTLEECIVKGQQVTRNYVKRQHTWWNSSKLEIFHKFDKFPDEIDINAVKFE
ncbi:MAG: tRNA (adenosine(37)-N6)-dimethylallyltransferase MiaA [Pelagibacteraceae bacterium]|nr:tRNA (adenosine(37)-N6)-dimethylallyltransferase MiaA [Pelagibacteraceae bacterium]